jgi:hypothetical protein
MPAPLLNFEVPQATFDALHADLSPEQLKKALRAIVVGTQRAALKAVRAGVKEENSYIEKKYLDRVIEKISPQGDPPVAAVIVNNRRLPLIAFKVKGFAHGRDQHGGSVQIAKDLPEIVLKHAFLATVKAGKNKEHTGIFLRAKGVPNSVVKRGRKGELRKFTPAGFAERHPIQQQFGPGILSIVEIPAVLNRIEFDTAAEMQKLAAAQLDKYLNPKLPDPPVVADSDE